MDTASAQQLAVSRGTPVFFQSATTVRFVSEAISDPLWWVSRVCHRCSAVGSLPEVYFQTSKTKSHVRESIALLLFGIMTRDYHLAATGVLVTDLPAV